MSHGTSSGSPRPSRDRWLVSYADFMTLMFAFFATLYAISSVDHVKLTEMARALSVAFDDSAKARAMATSGQGVLPENGARLAAATPKSPAEVLARVERDLEAELKSHQLEVIVDRRGLVLS